MYPVIHSNPRKSSNHDSENGSVTRYLYIDGEPTDLEGSDVRAQVSSAMDDDRLTHVKKVTQHYMMCCALLENLQSAHYILLKAKQQALQLPGLARPMRYKLEESCREQAALLHMIADYKVKLMRDLDDAQKELLVPVRYLQDLNDETDEELRDIRENVFPHSD
jgi:hypothetical protein